MQLLELWQRLISFMETRLKYTAAPVQSLLREAMKHIEDLSFLEPVLHCAAEDFSVQWERCVEAVRKQGALNEEDASLWKDTGKTWGRLDRDSQLAALSLCAERTESLLREARNDVREKGKLYLSLGVSGGLAAALLLI